MTLSRGQELALAQLRDIAARSDGALEVLGEPMLDEKLNRVVVRLSIYTRPYRTPDGLSLRDRERFRLYVPDDFPFGVPALYFDHTRHAGTAHVQWGSYICLYQSTDSEWSPSDGMFGFFDRVVDWLSAAGRGELDPDDAPLHPPAVFPSSNTAFVIRADAPVPSADDGYWVGRADLETPRAGRFDVVGWTSLYDWDDVPMKASAAVAVLLNRPLPFEFPTKLNDFMNAIEKAGVSFSIFYKLLRLTSTMFPPGSPAYIVFGTPMRRKAAGEPLRQHVTAWEIPDEALANIRAYMADEDNVEARGEIAKWMVEAPIRWCQIFEQRPEVVNRRDEGSRAAWLRDKRVLLLGCGAIGSAVAESIVRSGASRLEIVDNGRVGPGLLVRQRYSDSDIGLAKVSALKARLNGLGLPCEVLAHPLNLKSGALTKFDLSTFDLVIDATASSGVSHRLEVELSEGNLPIPLIALTVSAAAQQGSVTVRMPDFSGGPITLNRQAKLMTHERHADHPVVRQFWPRKDELKVFQPEPGCSAPTFLGSAADLDYHAGGLLNLGLERIQTRPTDHASIDLVASPWTPVDRASPTLRFAFPGYQPVRLANHDARLLEAPAARRSISAEITRNSRVRSKLVETGGLLFGEIDDSHGLVWLDSASGPPPDSVHSAEKFICGTAGTAALAAQKARASGNSSRFIGIWHTHPVSRGQPSNDDVDAMFQLLYLQPFTPRQVVMLIVGFAASQPQFSYFLFRRDDFQLIKLVGADDA